MKSTLMMTTMTMTGNEFDVDGDGASNGATGDDNKDDDDGGSNGAMGSGVTGYDDDDNFDGRQLR